MPLSFPSWKTASTPPEKWSSSDGCAAQRSARISAPKNPALSAWKPAVRRIIGRASRLNMRRSSCRLAHADKRNKNDAADAEAICTAVTRQRFVPVKDIDQQSVLMLHRARNLLIRQRTMLVKALRADPD
jgi:hypothetical protein